ncbi:MAG: (d)CMP kinase [Magnetococcus sp. DMHC-6]
MYQKNENQDLGGQRTAPQSPHPFFLIPKKRLIVAVDGPAGSGKGTVCRAVASRLGFEYLDTGAIYRAVALSALRQSITDPDALIKMIQKLNFKFQSVAPMRYHAFLNDEDVTDTLREERVGQMASQVATIESVREALLEFQRRYGGDHSVILDGRDVGTVVFPEADLKIFMTASLEERAKRRALELQQAGKTVNFLEIQDRMQERDERDAERQCAPLRPAPDAKMVDTTRLTPEECTHQVIQFITMLIREST